MKLPPLGGSRFTRLILNRISEASRPKAIENIKYKIYNFNDTEIANKNMPASSAIGQSIALVKNILFNQDASYIRQVIDNIVRYL